MKNSAPFVFALVLVSLLPAQGNLLAVAWTGASSLIDSGTGTGTSLGAAGAAGLNSLAYHPLTGLFYTVGSGSASTSGATLYTVSPTTGAATSTGITLTVSDVRGLAVSPAGIVYAIINGTPDKLYTVDVNTGIATLVGNTGSSSIQALACSSSGTLFAWAVNPTGAVQGTLMTIDSATAATTTVGNGAASIQALAFSGSGVLYGCGQTLYTVSTTTAVATQVGAGGLGDVRGIEFTSQAPPSISFLPANGQVAPGGALVVLYNAAANGGESFIPIPSCTLGNFFAPPLPQPLGIGWDACTDFYFNDPYALAVLPLSGLPGSFVGTLDPAGTSTGLVLPPASFPPGQNLSVHLTFISINAAFGITVHGVGTFVIN